MDERSSRIFVGLCLLVLVWIGVYWMWEPERDAQPRITFAAPVEQQPAPMIEPVLEPEPVVDELVAPEFVPVIRPKIIASLDDDHQEPVRVIPPEFNEYIVLEDENMGSIARKLYGSSGRWDVIARANPRVDPEKLKIGQVIRVPVDPDNIQGKVVTGDSDDGNKRVRPSKVVEYFIQSGDSLSRISERFYGSARHARMIYEYNRDTLESMDDLKIGQLLRLPPLEEAGG